MLFYDCDQNPKELPDIKQKFPLMGGRVCVCVCVRSTAERLKVGGGSAADKPSMNPEPARG